MRWYIAGPMRNIKYYNFPAFDKAADELRDAGYEVFNPASFDRDAGFDPMLLPDDHDWSKIPDQMNLDDIVARDLEELQKCDGLYALEGWEKSAGARAEHALAEWLGLDIVYEVDPYELDVFPRGCKDTNPKDSIASRKAGLGNVPGNVLIELGLAMKEGAHKYGAYNWRVAGVSARVYYEAAIRHIIAWWEGEDLDHDSGMPIPHTVKAMACLVVLRDAERQGMLTDDRPVKSVPFMSELNAWASQLVDKYPHPVPAYTQQGVDRGEY